MNFGIDVGNGYTKYKGCLFASKVRVGDLINFGKKKENVYEVEMNGTKYVVGEGANFTGDNRYYEDYYKLCLLTAIALSAKGEDFIENNLVLGLPEKKFKLNGEKLKKHILGIGQQEIKINGINYIIRTKDCTVFIEGAYPILTEEEENVIIIDNGAGTINVSQWENMSIINSVTYGESMNKMYADVANYLNSNKGADFKPSEIEKILNKKNIIINNVETDITDIRPIVENHITEIASYIRNDFQTKNASKIYLIGGGGADTIQYWKKQFPVINLVENSQFINQKVYELVANSEYGENNE